MDSSDVTKQDKQLKYSLNVQDATLLIDGATERDVVLDEPLPPVWN